MLHIVVGRANTGKSAFVLEEIRRLGDSSRQLLLVPEHASHQVELDLCRHCGDEVGRHAEVLSIRRLANRVLAQTGGAGGSLDAGGKILAMQLALREVMSALRVYAKPSRRAPFLGELVQLCDELQAYRISPEQLEQAAEQGGGDKLRDLSLIYAAYLAGLRRSGEDRRDLVERLLERLADYPYAKDWDIFLDGFQYFTRQEEQLIALLLQQANTVTITLLGDKHGRQEIFCQSLQTRERLERLAADMGVPCRETFLKQNTTQTPLAHLERHFFGEEMPFDGACDGVVLYRSDTVFSETEWVASQILKLVSSGEYRFRDIAVCVRNLEDYAATLESVLERYGIPAYLSSRSDILEKPVLSLVAGVLASVANDYEYEDMFRWLKTGLAGITQEECDLLENYVLRWDIHGAMWLRDTPWTALPERGDAEEQTALLEEINRIRHKISPPLACFADGLRREETAIGKLTCLWQLLDELGLAAQLTERTQQLIELGELQQAQEYSQLWQLLCDVMDQFAETLGDMPLEREQFARLFLLILTQYDVGTIPASLDQVQVMQITRNDRHNRRCVFLMGCNDHVMPSVPSGGSLLSREERLLLQQQGIRLAPDGEELLQTELMNIYAAVTQPTERLTLSYPATGTQGEPLRPSFVISRVRRLLPGVTELREESGKPYRFSALTPALEMVGSLPGDALWEFLSQKELFAQKLDAMAHAANMGRGRLSPEAVTALYGKRYRMSASRLDQINTCHFAYFMQYGLKARERTPAKLDAMQVGTFLHYILEFITRESIGQGGFAKLTEEERKRLIEEAIQRYLAESIPDFDQRNERFRYLFRRLKHQAMTIVANITDELTTSDFQPVAVELAFGEDGQLPAIAVEEGGVSLSLTGKVDRVDGWLKDDTLYLRVVDYKSGKKAFQLSDLCYGLNMQMLLYLFTLERSGEGYFNRPVQPAGVLYVPARELLLSAPRDLELEKLRDKLDSELRRTGLLLSQPEVLTAMEHSALEKPRFLPMRMGKSGIISDSLATAERFGQLGRYLDQVLAEAARELQNGNINADPKCHAGQPTPCDYCAYASACHFGDGQPEDKQVQIQALSDVEFWNRVEEAIGEEAHGDAANT